MIVLISLAFGFVLLLGGALVMYMGSLAKSAYQLKVEIKNQMDEGQRKVEEDVDKKTRWIKRDLVEEVEKIKAALQAENQRRFTELASGLERRIGDVEEFVRHEHGETARLLEGLRADVMVLDQRFRNLRRERAAASTRDILSNTSPVPAAMDAPPATPLPEPGEPGQSCAAEPAAPAPQEGGETA